MKILLVGAEFFHEEGRKDGRTDGRMDRPISMTELTVIFASLLTQRKWTLIWKLLQSLAENCLQNKIYETCLVLQ